MIEHIGTVDGHAMLSSNYEEARQAYANEIIRVTKPGGRILVACPNKSFPIDIQHGCKGRIRGYIYKRTGLNIHQIWGKYHLLSYAETRNLFCLQGGAHSFKPLPLKGYLGFGRFESGFLKPFAQLAKLYMNNLPNFLRPTFANPYILVEIRK